jgi:SAM-dependent methyltransferase
MPSQNWASMIAFLSNKGSASNPQFWPDYWKTVTPQLNTRYVPEYAILTERLRPTDRILDIGCGRGELVRELLRKGYRARGIDFDADSILDSVKHHGYFPSEIGDLNHLPYKENSFDVVLLAGTIEHVYAGPLTGFSEAYRVLRPGGFLVLTIPYINFIRKLLFSFYFCRDAVMSKFPNERERRFFQWVFTCSEVKRILAATRFSVCEWRRAYYTTVLRKIPGAAALTELVFGHRPPARLHGIKTDPSGAAPRASHGFKRVLKHVIEGTLNMIIPNRLIVVARKPS